MLTTQVLLHLIKLINVLTHVFYENIFLNPPKCVKLFWVLIGLPENLLIFNIINFIMMMSGVLFFFLSQGRVLQKIMNSVTNYFPIAIIHP